MKNAFSFHLIMTYFLASCGLITGCSDDKPTHIPASKEFTLPVGKIKIGAPLEYVSTGSVISNHRINLASRLSGHIQDIRVKEGDPVKQDQLLVLLDSADVENQIKQLEAQTSAAQTALNDTQTDVDRFKGLFSQGYVSEMDARKLKLRLDSQRELLKQSQAALDSAKAQRDYIVIRSPIDGYVVHRLRVTGDLAQPGEPILVIESGDDLVFETQVTDQQVGKIQSGSPVVLAFDGIDQPISASVQSLVRSADPVTRSYPVRISMPHQPLVKPGMFGRARFSLGELAVPVVPKSALIERGGLWGVYALSVDDHAAFRWIRTGRDWTDVVEVTAGLEANDRFVLRPNKSLQEGDLIKAEGAAP